LNSHSDYLVLYGMTNISDLHIEEEILPLFDFTHNLNSGQEIRDILTKPPGAVAEILFRQQVLRGFIGNGELLKDYSYSRFNLSDVHSFFESFSAGSFLGLHLRRELMFSEKERHFKRGKLIILILLFNKIHTTYLGKIDKSLFPAEYATELERLNGFFLDFDLERYELILRNKKKIRVSHIVELTKTITEKVTNGQAASFWKRWFLFEAYLSVSHGIIRHGFVFPIFEEKTFSIQGLYHPLVKNPVKNDFIASRNVILLTGPNMSGKSTFLKAVSLSVYLGYQGLAVPAAKATIPHFDTISVAINLTDSIVSGYSHFMSEVVTLKNVLREAGENNRCFAVFDELFRGTNIEDAQEISTATIKGLVKFTNSLFLISTHLHQLKDMEEIKNGTVATCFIECELNDNTPRFTYKLKEGWSDLRLGRVLFDREGLNLMLQRNSS
jgi:DNA mismatch repair protein MutS